ncbi:MAG: transposase [Gammaproteobacteria bacterium]|nr:transposase [Gammaproteobacteria bacterium]
MGRGVRNLVAGGYYHLINRGNDRSVVFHHQADYRAFLRLISEAQARVGMRLIAYCLMPNHFHLVASPQATGDVSRWMHWLLTTHTHRYHLDKGTSGRVWQGRFKAFPIKCDAHLLTVLRYVERNALRSGLVQRAEDWPWGSLAWRLEPGPGSPLSDSPVPLPPDWRERVNDPQTPAELEALRTSVNRQAPFGDEVWCGELDWRRPEAAATRPRGRPMKNR